MKKHKIHIDQIGEVEMVKSQIASRINITIKPLSIIKVSVPQRVSFQVAKKAVIQKIPWILKNQKKMAEYEKNASVFTEESKFQTRNRHLEISKWTKDTISASVTKRKIIVHYPEKKNVRDNHIQNTIRSAIVRALRKEAKEYLPRRIAQIAEENKISYQNVFIKNQRSRWGSCSAANNINLNLHLMRLPDRLIDLVITHELCHVIEKNHSKNFYGLLEKMLPDYKELNKELKKWDTQLY